MPDSTFDLVYRFVIKVVVVNIALIKEVTQHVTNGIIQPEV